jgi:hypothetical protein
VAQHEEHGDDADHGGERSGGDLEQAHTGRLSVIGPRSVHV